MDFLTKRARKRLLGQIRNAVSNTYKEGRLKFVGGNTVEFIGKDGRKQTLSPDKCAATFWSMWNDDMLGKIGFMQGNLMTFGITPDDIRGMIEELEHKK